MGSDSIDSFVYLKLAGIMKYIHVFHPTGCAKDAHSKLLQAILVNPWHFKFNTRSTNKKGQPKKTVDLCYWWRWRELNPRLEYSKYKNLQAYPDSLVRVRYW